MRRLLSCVLCGVVLMMVSCRPQVPSRYIQPGDLEDILYDYHIALAMARDRSEAPTSGASINYEENVYLYAVLKKHGVSRADFDSSLVYYYGHAYRLKNIYERVGERLSDEALAMGASVSEVNKLSMKTTGDTANIWADKTSMLLLPYHPYDKYQFSIKADTSFHKGDNFELNFTTNFLYQTGTKNLVAYMAVIFDNDSTASQHLQASVTGNSRLRVNGNKEHRIKELKGFFYLKGSAEPTTTLRLLFLSDIYLLRFHAKGAFAPATPPLSKPEPGALPHQPQQMKNLKREI